MMKPLYKQPLVEAVILVSGILCTVVLIHGVQNFIALGGKPVTSQLAQKSNPDLVNVAAGSCEGLGDVDKRPPNGTQVPADVPTDKINNFGLVIKDGLTEAPSGEKVFGNNISSANIDPAHIMLDGLVDGPITLANVWSVTDADESKTSAAVRKNEVIAIRTTVGQVIKTPDSGRKILDGSNLSGMAMYVSEDGVRFANSRNDKPTANEGYNLYIWGITPDPGLVSRYQCANDTLGRQKMPEMHVGDPLGTANSEFVYLALRDNGAFQDLLDTSWWNGRIKAGETTGAAVPPGGGAVAPAGSVLNAQISENIELNGVQDKHKDLLRTKGDVAVAGDSTTAITPFPFLLEGEVPTKVAEGLQGANWLRVHSNEFPENGRFALILIGVNEVHNGDDEKETGAGKLKDFKSNLDTIVKYLINKKKTLPVLQEIRDFNGLNLGYVPGNLEIVNKAIFEVAQENSIPYVKTSSYITASHMEPDGYHFNAAGAQLRNQILGVVNTKLIALTASSAAPVATKVSGKIKLIGKGTYTIDIYQTDSGTNYKRTDSDRVVTNLTSMDQVEWSFVPKDAKTCIFARMWTQAGAGVVEKWVDSTITCDLKAGDKDIELIITAPAVLAPAATNHTISGKVDLVGGTLGKKIILVYLEKEDGSLVSGRSSWADTSNRYSITEVPPGKYKLVADLDFDVGDGLTRKEIAQSEKVGVEISTKDVTKDLTIKVPSEISSKIYIRASKSAIENCTAAMVSAYCALSTTFDRRYSEAFIDITGPGTVTVTYNAQDVTELGQTYWQVKIENIKTKDPFATTDINFAVVTKSSPPYISLKPTHFEKIIK